MYHFLDYIELRKEGKLDEAHEAGGKFLAIYALYRQTTAQLNIQ